MRIHVERLLKWWGDVTAKLKARSWKAWAVVILIVGFLADFARSRATEGATSLLGYAGKGVGWLIGVPIGFVGLGLLVYILLLVGLAYYDSRPKPQPAEPVLQVSPPSPAPPPLTVEQKLELDEARKFWTKHGNPAHGYGLLLGQEAIQDIAPRNLAITLLGQTLTPQVQEYRESLEFLLGDHGTKPLPFVVDAIEAAHPRYMELSCWLNWAIDRASNDGLEHAEKWRTSHAAYLAALEDLSSCSGYSHLKYMFQSSSIRDRFPDSALKGDAPA